MATEIVHENLVSEDLACPWCCERAAGRLLVGDGENIRCTSCGYVYTADLARFMAKARQLSSSQLLRVLAALEDMDHVDA